MAVAVINDVEVELGRTLSTEESAQAGVWLDRAERQIVKRLGPVANLDQDAVRDVETMAVAAKVSNPTGASSETVDDYTYRLPTETRRVTILDEWWALLSPATSSYTISLAGPDPDPLA